MRLSSHEVHARHDATRLTWPAKLDELTKSTAAKAGPGIMVDGGAISGDSRRLKWEASHSDLLTTSAERSGRMAAVSTTRMEKRIAPAFCCLVRY